MLSTKKADLYTGIFSIIVALAFYFQTGELAAESKVLPLVLVVFLIVSGIVLVIRGFIGKNDKPLVADIVYSRAFIMLAAAVVYLTAIVYVGFYTSSFIFLVLMSWLLNDQGRSLKTLGVSVIFGVVITAAVYLTFTLSLKVPTPIGLFY